MSALTERRTDVGSGHEVIDVTGLPRDKYGWYVVERSINWPGIALFLGLWVVAGLVGWGILQVVLALHGSSDNGVDAGGRKDSHQEAVAVPKASADQSDAPFFRWPSNLRERAVDHLVVTVAQQRVGDRYRVLLGDCGTVIPDSTKPDRPVAGCFKAERPDVLFLAESYFHAPERYTDIAATVRKAQNVAVHELAHAIVYDTCATGDPGILGEWTTAENLADSLSWYYLGAEYRHAYVGSPYGVTVEGVHAAMAVYEQGLCGGRIPEEIAARPTSRAY